MANESKCKACQAPIYWLKTKKGKSMPVDAGSYNDEAEYVHGKHVPHWSTCPHAQDFHKRTEDRHAQKG
jgi:hypothetical protein